MGEDYRTRLTKKIIVECFMELLKERPLDRITVTAICDRAQINRTTFYRYFDNPLNLYDSLESLFLDEMKCLTVRNINANAERGSFQQALVEVLMFFKENKDLLLVMRSKNGNFDFASRMLKNTFEFMTQTPGLTYPELTERQNEWLFQYTGYGASAAIYSWLEGGLVEPIEELALFLADCARGTNSFVRGRADKRFHDNTGKAVDFTP